jgi:hypothetical protein
MLKLMLPYNPTSIQHTIFHSLNSYTEYNSYQQSTLHASEWTGYTADIQHYYRLTARRSADDIVGERRCRPHCSDQFSDKKYSLYKPILSYVCILVATYSIICFRILPFFFLCTLKAKDAFGTPSLNLCGAGCLNRYSDSLRAVRPGFERQWGTRFSTPVQTGPGAHSVSCKIDTGSPPRG